MTTTSLREEIAEQFHECMGYWEGIKVPDWDDGHSSIDYANQVLKLFEKRIDKLLEQSSKYEWVNALVTVKEILK